jgi:hypothetical protein
VARGGDRCALAEVESNPDGMGLADIGRRFGLSRERVRQIEELALLHLAQRLAHELRAEIPGGRAVRGTDFPSPADRVP